MRTVSDAQRGQATQQVPQIISYGGHTTINIAGDESASLGELTAEDWDGARRALGPGSKSLLFGTSTKVLDSIVEHFKRQAPSAPAAYAELAEVIREAAEQGGYVIVSEGTTVSTLSPSDTYDGSERGPKQVPLAHIRDLAQQVLREVFERIEEQSEERG